VGKIIGEAFPIGGRVDANIFDEETGVVLPPRARERFTCSMKTLRTS
jgi:hypothetical protein